MGIVVTKKKAAPPPDPKPARKVGRPKGEPGTSSESTRTFTVPMLSLKGTKEYADWFDRFASHTEIAKTKLIRRAIKLMVANQYPDFDPPPDI